MLLGMDRCPPPNGYWMRDKHSSHNKTTKSAASSQPWDVVWASTTSYEPSSTATPAEAGTNC
jgi:hypothetical protein